MTATHDQSLEALLLERHPLPEWATFTELARCTGYTPGRIDVATFNVWQSNNYLRIAYEVKKSRGDFLCELRNPDKRAWVEKEFNETYFCCEQGVVKDPGEIPEGWGLIVRTKKGDKIRRTKVATYREAGDINTKTVLSLLRRNCSEMARYKADKTLSFEGAEITRAQLDEMVNGRVGVFIEQHHKQMRELHDEKQKLKRDRLALRGPFERLLTHTGLTPYQSRWELEDLTKVEVKLDEWFTQARQRVLHDIEHSLSDTRDRLDMAIRHLQTQRDKATEAS